VRLSATPLRTWAAALAGLCLCLTLDAAAEHGSICPQSHCEAVIVPAGTYQPFFKSSKQTKIVIVPAFLLDVTSVSRGAFLEFVRRNSKWRKSQVKGIFAEGSYLAGWKQDLEPGGPLAEPVTFVSWFAAQAYCEDQGKRLPTVAEWERAAGAQLNSKLPLSAAVRGEDSPLEFAMGTTAAELGRNGPGFGKVWEWTSDFNSTPVPGRSENGASSSLFCGDGYRSNRPSDYAAFLRYSFRSSLRGNYTLKNLGFRCAQDLR
jgi:formylglycine-generating enzyme required for sulfatase activity